MSKLDTASIAIAKASGTTLSLIVHVVFITGILLLYFAGVNFDTVLLLLTTILSVEAIFLSIFVQIVQNKVVEQSPDVEI